MKNLKIGIKLIGGFCLVALITLVVGLIGVKGIAGLGDKVAELGGEKLPAVQHLGTIKEAGQRSTILHRTLLNPQLSASERAALYAEHERMRALISTARTAYKELPRTEQADVLWQKLAAAWTLRCQAVDRFLELSRAVDATGILDPARLRGDLQQFRGNQYETAVMVQDYIHTGMGFGWNYDLANSPFELWTASFQTQNPKLRDLIKQARTTHAEFYEAVSAIRELRRAGDKDGAQARYEDIMVPTIEATYDVFFALLQVADEAVGLYQEMMVELMGPVQQHSDLTYQLLDELIEVTSAGAQSSVVAAQGAVARATLLSSLGMAIGAVLAVVFGVLLTLGITRPLSQTLGMIQDLAAGQLGRRLNMKHGDEIGKMAQAMDSFADNLEHEVLEAFDRLAHGDFTFEAHGLIREPLGRANHSLNELVRELQKMAGQISGAGSQVADASQTLSQGATEQASSLEEISASLNEIVGQVRQGAEHAGQADRLSTAARGAAEQGANKMQAMTQAMGEINLAGQNISKIIKTIEEIAFQTNLLALNAAVEAARAGQHGKGFAVVAEEVRNLAARSAKAAQETAELIEGTVEKTNRGTRIAKETAEALDGIVEGVSKVSDLVGEIAAAVNEQAEGIGQINVGLNQIDQVTQQNTASAEESAAAAEELSSQAEQLRHVLSRFRLAESPAGQPRTQSLPVPTEMRTGEDGPILMRWSEDLSVGIHHIDRQHQKLVGMVNQMFAALKGGKGDAVLGDILDQLVDYTQKHFFEEERMMKSHGYPDFDEHKAAHAHLVSQVADFQKKFKAGKVSVSSELFNFLKGWLINHIQGTDKKYGPYLNERGVL